MNADGGGERLLTRNAWPVAWSPSGRKILLGRGVGQGRGDALRAYVYVVNADGSGLRRLTRMAQVAALRSGRPMGGRSPS